MKLSLSLILLGCTLAVGCAHLKTANFPESDNITQIVIKDLRTSDAPHIHTLNDATKIGELTAFLDKHRAGWKPYRMIGPAPVPIEVRLYHNQRLIQIVRFGNGDLLTGIDRVECHRTLPAAEEKELLALLRLDGAAHSTAATEKPSLSPTDPTK